MKRVCLFAGYDSQNKIHDYVVYYIKELSTVADVYYMADNEISDDEKAKITPYVKEAYGFNHKKYDFGSWQELIKIIGWGLFEKLEKDKEWDICGMDRVYNANRNIWYISSYFLVFKKIAFLSDIFKNHFMQIENNISYDKAVKYLETPFMAKFYTNGYNVKSFAKETEIMESLEKDFQIRKVPFLKKKQFFIGYFYKLDKAIQFIQNHTNYNYKLIENYMETYKDKKPKIDKTKPSFLDKIKNIRRWLISINLKKHQKVIKIMGKVVYKKLPQLDNIECPITIIKKDSM